MATFTSTISVPVRPPALEPPPICLVSAARLRDEDGERWGNGVAFSPHGCPPGRSGAIDPCDGSTVRTITSLSGNVEFNPIQIWGADECSTYGWEARDYVDRAKSVLLATESYWLEKELFSAPITGNPALASSGATVVSGGPYSPSAALIQLEQGLADNTTGNRAMIHVRPIILGALVEAKLVRRVGNIWLDFMDNVVVPGRGYAGTGPAGQAVGATEWVYASGIVEIIRGPIHHFPERPGQEIVRTTNDVQVYVDRLAIALWDPCIHLAVEVTTPPAAATLVEVE